MLREKINEDLKTSMKAKDERRVSTLRMINAAIKNAEIEARGQGKQLSDDDLMGLLQKMVKQRQESILLYDKGGRAELADREREEIAIIQGFLPQQMGEDQARAAIAEIIKQEGATSVKDMGRVMAALKAAYAGRMDFAKASGLVRAMLQG
ncbi:MAG TPA: GatB/YqeY domain-containing protein [Xanthobacteraceae bacterium]|nr:GatB/YqeY domain-containing protein [Xanthobacteraceae bacterium]